MRYKIGGINNESIIDTLTGRAVLTLSMPKWEATLQFECKVRNGLIEPVWFDDTLIWVPTEGAKYAN